MLSSKGGKCGNLDLSTLTGCTLGHSGLEQSLTPRVSSFSQQNFNLITIRIKAKPLALRVFKVLAAFSLFVSLWYGFFLALTQVNR